MNDYLHTPNTLTSAGPFPGTKKPKVTSKGGVGGDTDTGPLKFSNEQKWSFFGSGIVDLLKAGSIYTKGKYQAAQLNTNANALNLNLKALERDIDDINYIVGIHASNTMKQGAEMRGKQLAAQAESGFSVSETESFQAQLNYTDILIQDQVNQYAYEAAMEIENKRNEMAAVKAQQELLRIESDYIKKTSAVAAGLQFLKGAASIFAAVPHFSDPRITFQGAVTNDGMYGAFSG